MDLIKRQDAINAMDSETADTNPEHFKSNEKFIEFMDDADIASFGWWQWANGFSTALVAARIQLEKLPSTPRWIPCTERLPNHEECIKNNGLFNVSDGDRSYSEWFDIRDKQQFGEPTMSGFFVDYAVIAWMPLPEVYRESEKYTGCKNCESVPTTYEEYCMAFAHPEQHCPDAYSSNAVHCNKYNKESEE